MKEFTASLQKHYSRGPNTETILGNLRRKGLDLARLRPQDLYPYDQSHAGGIKSTRMLASRAGIEPHSCVVDVGCGIGGAARFLHTEFSCRVLGFDLALTRLRTAIELTRLVSGKEGKTKQIHFLAAQADSLPLPFHFADIVWTQHLLMNLPDLPGFLRESARVLKPSGRLAAHEWFLNHQHHHPGELRLPLPWASNSSLNHAVSSSDFLQMLQDHDFVPKVEDVTAVMQEVLRRDVQALVLHKSASERITALENLLQAADEGTFSCLMITARKKRVRSKEPEVQKNGVRFPF